MGVKTTLFLEDDDVSEFTVVERILKKERWYVRIQRGTITRTIPNANYIWLLSNPSFKAIPFDYVVHHLDLDQLNDDPSNLVIMYKHHHVAHHIKMKRVIVPILVDSLCGWPVYRPCAIRSRDGWSIHYVVRDENGKHVKKRIYNRGKAGDWFKTKDEAEQFIPVKWPMCRWE